MQGQALELLSRPAAEALAFLVEEEGDDGDRFDLQRVPEDAMDEVVQTMYFQMAAKVWDFPQPPTE